MAIECCYGQLKRRFPLLKFGIRFTGDCVESARLITAAVCIFNFCKRGMDEDFDEDNQYEIQNIEINQNNDIFQIMENLNGQEKREAIMQMYMR